MIETVTAHCQAELAGQTPPAAQFELLERLVVGGLAGYLAATLLAQPWLTLDVTRG